jgi:nitrogen fixation NifU-like protein
MYSKTVLEHFASPQNVGVIEQPDGYARIKSSLHDDLIELYLKVEDGHIADIRFRTFGCAAAIASSSMTTVLAKGLTLAQAEDLSEDDVVAALGGLPEGKIKCSVLAPEALRQALADYRSKHVESVSGQAHA